MPRDVWKSSTTVRGEQFATMNSPTLMLTLSATALGSGLYCDYFFLTI